MDGDRLSRRRCRPHDQEVEDRLPPEESEQPIASVPRYRGIGKEANEILARIKAIRAARLAAGRKSAEETLRSWAAEGVELLALKRVAKHGDFLRLVFTHFPRHNNFSLYRCLWLAQEANLCRSIKMLTESQDPDVSPTDIYRAAHGWRPTGEPPAPRPAPGRPRPRRLGNVPRALAAVAELRHRVHCEWNVRTLEAVCVELEYVREEVERRYWMLRDREQAQQAARQAVTEP